MRMCVIALCLNLVLAVPAVAAAPASKEVHAVLEAAYQGDAISQYRLALMLLSGQGMTADTGLAVSWFQCAASQGITEAQFQLAKLELQGIAPGGNTAAYKWLLLSEGKNPDRIALRQQLASEMRPELVGIISKQAAAWRPKVTPLTPYVKGKRPACFDQQ